MVVASNITLILSYIVCISYNTVWVFITRVWGGAEDEC